MQLIPSLPKRWTACLLAATTAALLPSCSAISKINLIPVSQDPVLGAQAYPELLAPEQTIESGRDYNTVVSMTDKLVRAAKEIDPEVANLFDWEVVLVRRDDLVNAWCLPGGKMAVYTGILPVAAGTTGDFETGLAVVMGHEIAHATLRHGTRAMTRQMGVNGMIQLAGALIGGGDGAAAIIQGANFGANFLTLSFGRGAELESDRRGLMYMAHAGYDPREAVAFWQRMQAARPRRSGSRPTRRTRIGSSRSRASCPRCCRSTSNPDPLADSSPLEERDNARTPSTGLGFRVGGSLAYRDNGRSSPDLASALRV